MWQFILYIADANGYPLPVQIQHSNGSITEDDDESKAIVVLLPRLSKRSLHRKYLNFQAKMENHIALNTFIDVLYTDVSHVRASLRARRLFDICFVFHNNVCTTSDSHLAQKEIESCAHLNAAEITGEFYRDTVESA